MDGHSQALIFLDSGHHINTNQDSMAYSTVFRPATRLEAGLVAQRYEAEVRRKRRGDLDISRYVEFDSCRYMYVEDERRLRLKSFVIAEWIEVSCAVYCPR